MGNQMDAVASERSGTHGNPARPWSVMKWQAVCKSRACREWGYGGCSKPYDHLSHCSQVEADELVCAGVRTPATVGVVRQQHVAPRVLLVVSARGPQHTHKRPRLVVVDDPPTRAQRLPHRAPRFPLRAPRARMLERGRRLDQRSDHQHEDRNDSDKEREHLCPVQASASLHGTLRPLW